MIVFAVPEEYYILLKKAEYLRTYDSTLIPVPTNEGLKWVKEHSAKEIAEAVQNFFPDTDIKMLENSIQRYKDIDVWSKDPYLDEEEFIFEFPEIEEDIEFQDNSTNVNDDWITKEEYNSLTELERNKLAFDRYKNRKKTKWEIGRDFEMYIGYLCSLHNCKVDYFGICELRCRYDS